MKDLFENRVSHLVQIFRPGYELERNRFIRFISIVAVLAITVLPFHLAIADSSQPSSIDSPPVIVGTEGILEDVYSQESDEAEVEGWLLSRPDDGIGEWQVQKDEKITVRVIGDSSTRLDFGVPLVGSWIKVKGRKNSDNSIQATRIRVNDYEADEIVMRLADNGVLSSTVASRYGLVATETLLQSGKIFLFRDANSNSEIEHILENINHANDSDILWAEYNFVGSAPGGNPFKVWGWGGVDPTGYENQYAFEQVNLGPALQKYQGENINIAILDTGVSLDHPQLSSHLIAGWDMVADDTVPQDEGVGFGWGHGTHVTGIIARIAPKASIMPLRVLDANGRGNTFTLAYAIDWAVAHDANVINLSLGTPYYSKVLADAVANAIDNNVVVVAAAGNNNIDVIQYPAGFDGVISVGALDSSNHKTSFSNYGDWVDLAAPGLGITSTIIGSEGLGYASWSGTSMSTGFVSGAAALIKEKNNGITPENVEKKLKDNGANIGGGNPQNIGRLLNISQAVGVNGNSATSTPTPTATSITPQATPTPRPTNDHATPTAEATPVPTTPTSKDSEKVFLPLITK